MDENMTRGQYNRDVFQLLIRRGGYWHSAADAKST